MAERAYVCIDLKSFYASVECVDRGLDPFCANLVVADPSRGSGAICLAVSPAMKALGVSNRCRIFEIPKSISYLTAMPRMKRYMEVSADIYSIYLKYISHEDIHVYSIDECFIDVTTYLALYSRTPKEMAVMLMDAVFSQTGIRATAGLGPNLFLAKVALDVTAKHAADHIGILDEAEFERSIWRHRPITDIWNIGPGIAKRLEKYGVYDLHGVTCLEEGLLYREFGANAEYLMDHARGMEPCTIKEIHEYKSKSNSLSNSQILFEDYSLDDAYLVLKEMVDTMVLELVDKRLVTNSISLSIGYSKNAVKSTGGTRKLKEYTNSFHKLMAYFNEFYHSTAQGGYPIRRIGIGLNNVVEEAFATFDFFTDLQAERRERQMQDTILTIKKKYGRNAIVKGVSLEEKATARMRNKLIGGHNSE